jgi:hypothetical protein
LSGSLPLLLLLCASLSESFELRLVQETLHHVFRSWGSKTQEPLCPVSRLSSFVVCGRQSGSNFGCWAVTSAAAASMMPPCDQRCLQPPPPLHADDNNHLQQTARHT